MNDTVPDTASPNDGPPAIWPATHGSKDGDGRPGPQPHMQVDHEMGQDKANQSDAMSDHSDLMEAARRHALRTCTAKDLHALALRLQEECERARVAAISALHDPAPRSGGYEDTDCNYGFAYLFSALRRARAELAARDPGHPKPVSLKSPMRPRSAGPPASSLGATIPGQQKARR